MAAIGELDQVDGVVSGGRFDLLQGEDGGRVVVGQWLRGLPPDGPGGEAKAPSAKLAERVAVVCGELAKVVFVDRDAVLAPLSHAAPL